MHLDILLGTGKEKSGNKENVTFPSIFVPCLFVRLGSGHTSRGIHAGPRSAEELQGHSGGAQGSLSNLQAAHSGFHEE